MHHRRLLAAAALLALPAPLYAQTTATWLSPTSGSWTVGSNWSTNTPPGPGISALIAATGSPYTVTAPSQISPNRLDLTSPDATLDLMGGAFNTTLNLTAGTTRYRGGAFSNTAVRGTAPLTIQPYIYDTIPSFTNLTLATDLDAAVYSPHVDFHNTLTLDGGTVHMSSNLRPYLLDNLAITGTGTFVADPGSDVEAIVTGNNPSLSIGPNVTFKTVPNGGDIFLDSDFYTGTANLASAATFSAEQPNTAIHVGYGLNLTNTGTLSASNGGALYATFPAAATTGTLALATGGTLSLDGPDYTLDHPLTVPATARLELNGGWKNASTLTLDAGTLTLDSNPTSPGTIQYLNSPTVELHRTLSAPSLPLLNTTPSTHIVLNATLDLAYSPFAFTSVPGQWSLPSGGGTLRTSMIQNGTLTTGAAGNDLLPGGGSVYLSNVTVDFPLSIDDGTITANSNTTFAQPVSLSGGQLSLISFTNAAGISVTGGILDLPSLPTSPGTISISAGTLQLDFTTSPAQVASLPFGTPSTLAIGPDGNLDLQAGSLDLSTLPYEVVLAGAKDQANLTNGTLVDSTHNHPLRIELGSTLPVNRDRIANLDCSADITIATGATLYPFNSSFHNSHISGGGTLDYGIASSPQTTTLDHVTLDNVPLHIHSNSPLTITNGLTTNSTLTIDPGSVVDLTTSALLLNYTTPSPADTIRTYLLDGRLTSSSADPTHRLGYLDSTSALTVQLTLTGDANLDGRLTPDDYALLDRSYASSLPNAHWQDGDFNYDGLIDQNDYLLIDQTLFTQAQGFSPGFLSLRESQFGQAYVSTLLASVPEPTFLSLLLFPPLLLPRRRT